MFSRWRPSPTPTEKRCPTSSQHEESRPSPQTGWQASTKYRRVVGPAWRRCRRYSIANRVVPPMGHTSSWEMEDHILHFFSCHSPGVVNRRPVGPGRRTGKLKGLRSEGVRTPSSSNRRGYREVLISEDLELLPHQRVQFLPVLVEVIQDPRDRRLHLLERLVPARQRLLAQELPQPFDQVEVGRVGREEHQAEFQVALQPVPDERLLVVGGVVQVEDELFGLGMSRSQQAQQVDELLAIDAASGQAQVEVLVVVGAVGPEDVQPLAPVADTDVEALPDQQPARVEQPQPPDGMAGIDEIPPGGRTRLAAMPPILADERLLLLPVGLPEEAADLVVTGPDATQQRLDPALGVADLERLLDPGGDLADVVEASGLDFGLEALDLGATELPGVARVVERGEPIEPWGAVGADPLADLTRSDPEGLGDPLLRHPVVEPEQGVEAGDDPAVRALLPAFLDLGTGSGVKGEGRTQDPAIRKHRNRAAVGDALRIDGL